MRENSRQRKSAARTSVGYSAALMADAGGPGCEVDTVESDPVPADMAESELAKPGLAEKARVLRGDAKDVLRRLPGPYEAVL